MQRLAPICLGLIGLTASNALIASPPVADYIIKQNGASVVPLSTLTRSRPATSPVPAPSPVIPPIVRPVVKEASVVAKPSIAEPTAPVRPTVTAVAAPVSPKKEEPARPVQIAPVEKPVIASPAPIVAASKPDPAPVVAVSKSGGPAPVVVAKKPDPTPVAETKKPDPVPEKFPVAVASSPPAVSDVVVPQGLSASEILAGVVAPIKKAIANVLPTPTVVAVTEAKPTAPALAVETRKTIEAVAAVAAAFEANSVEASSVKPAPVPVVTVQKVDSPPLATKSTENKPAEALAKVSSVVTTPSPAELVKTAAEPVKPVASSVKETASSDATAKPYENDLQWQQKEAAKETSKEPTKAAVTPPPASNRIAVLLPTRSTVLGDAAKVVRAGVEAAAKVDGGPEILVIDSGDTDVPARYREALAAGAKVVIGPLARPQIAAISSLAKVPTLALNTLEGAPANVYSLNLSVEGEAKALARRVYGDGLRRPIIVAGNGGFDKRIAQSFAAEWQALGGKNLRRLAPNTLTNITESDVAILAVESAVAKPLLPSLSGRPIYATSQLHERTGPRLAGVTLMDMPWLAASGDKLVARYPRPSHTQTISSDRLYALGIDAWRLATRLAADPTATSLHLDGVTGGLTLSKTREFDRVLSVVR